MYVQYLTKYLPLCLGRSGSEEMEPQPAAEHLREDTVDIQKYENRPTADTKVCLLSGPCFVISEYAEYL